MSLMTPGAKLTKNIVETVIDKVDESVKEQTGNSLDPKIRKLLRDIFNTSIDLLLEGAESGKIQPKDLAIILIKRLNAFSQLGRDESAMIECGTALVALAVTTAELYPIIMTSGQVAMTTGMTPVGQAALGVTLAGMLFWFYGLFDAGKTCGESWKKREHQLPKAYQIRAASIRILYINYSDNVCKIT